MNTFRFARAALRTRPVAATPASMAARAPFQAFQAQRRGYADAVADKIKLSLALPHQVCFSFL